MSTSAINNNNQVAANVLPNNPFSDWKSTVNLDPNTTVVSNLSNELATLILSYLPIEQVRTIMENIPTQRNPYHEYRGIMGDANCSKPNEHTKSSLTGTELVKFQRYLSLEGQELINGLPPQVKSWAELLAKVEMSLTHLKKLDLSDSSNMTDQDVIALTKSSPNLTTLILPGVIPSVEVMAVLRANCPQVVIYPSAMTEHEWAHPAEFMAKLPPPPQAITDFINSPRPIWEGKTSAEVHMVVPRVNKIVRDMGRLMTIPWTWKNVSVLDQVTDGVGCVIDIRRDFLQHRIMDKSSDVGFEWIVFTKDILPGSRNQSDNDQKKLVEHWGYEMPGFVDAITCMLLEKRISGNRIYNDVPMTYTRCMEMLPSSRPLIAGNFAPVGAEVFHGYYDADCIGVGGLKRFKV